ncbi:LapA family protein [Mycobacterium paraffinicum]|uniref:UsfY protein n=1 Tax=Mycobacterium paraffinicum TaxID=53378 RepID=A0ABP8RHV7_9MYCO|nr:LapA family protein [Mycobacterium paraffinicum]MCV7309057.1 LapA family protein [Mycobacterium paraffinicum]
MSDRPVDHERTLRRGSAEPAHGLERTPGLVIVGAAVLALVTCVATFALGDAGAGVATAIVAMLAFGAGLAWLGMDRRRIRQAERDWPIGHVVR